MNLLTDFDFKRNSIIEKSIDRKHALYRSEMMSITVHLDILDELLESFHTEKDVQATHTIAEFIRGRKYAIRNWPLKILSEEERDYLNRLRIVHAKLEEDLLGKAYSHIELFWHLVKVLEEVCKDNFESKNIKAAIQERLDNTINIPLAINTSINGAILLYLKDYKHFFYIANDSGEYKAPAEIDYSVVSVILNGSNSISLLEEVIKQTNVVSVSLRNDGGWFQRILPHSSIDWCIEKVSVVIRRVRREGVLSCSQKFLSNLNDFKHELEILNGRIKHDIYSSYDILNKTDIKEIKSKIHDMQLRLKSQVEDCDRHYVFTALRQIDCFVRAQFRDMVQKESLYGDILFSLGEIRRNNTLYIASNKKGKSVEYAFGEENLSAILASNLKCINKRQNNNIYVSCEALVGNGRSDISIRQSNRVIAIIECKLARNGENISDKVISAIDQLYYRYSENESFDMSGDVALFAIVFSHDRDFRSVADSVSKAIDGGPVN